MKPLVIYHANCTDGFAAAWVFHHSGADLYDFHPATYGSTPPDVTGRRVYLVDFSYPRDVLLKMGETASYITILDHHKTAAQDLLNIAQEAAEGDYCSIQVVFDMERSGAGIAWDFVFPGRPRPVLLDRVEDRDLWRFKLPHTREMIACVNASPYTFETWDVLMSDDPVEIAKITASGSLLYSKFMKDVEETVCATKRKATIGGHLVPMANVPPFMASEAGQLLGQKAPFSATYYDGEKHRYFSLRSAQDGMDVGEIAKQYGGGGHKHAAGFRVTRDHELARA